MDINNIKRPDGYGPLEDAQAETPVKSKREASFAPAIGPVEVPDASKPAVLSQFSKAALQDATKVSHMVRACVSELIDSGQNATGSVSPADKQVLVDFLSEDPVIKRQIESYLRKALT